MSSKSNDQGRAYEFACLMELEEAIKQYRPVKVLHNSSYEAAKYHHLMLSEDDKSKFHTSAKAMISAIFDCEPMVIEDTDDVLELFIQKDEAGKAGDVRDIIIARSTMQWEIGLSIKHNHFAVKHSRLSPTIDFANKWFGYECSKEYWDAVKPVFDYLAECKRSNMKFNDLSDKEHDVYEPIVTAFIEEVKKQSALHSDVPQKMVEYLLSKFDFYKVISIDAQRLTQIQAYNTHGDLSKATAKKKPTIFVPKVSLPTRIVSIDFKPGSTHTAELYMNNGWTFSFRIHNAETMAAPTLKFDVQIEGMPTEILTINCIWK
mgnify:FL=1